MDNIVFEVGDTVVYRSHGVGKINSISKKKIGGSELKVFDITLIESGLKVVVPVGQNGLRRVIDKKAVEKIFTILKDRSSKVDTQTWNRRSREYETKLKTGSLYEIAKVLRDLFILRNEKELSYGEKQMLEKAQSLLVSEIAIAKARPEDKVKEEMEALFVH